jgi:Holliday junction resolvase RusA-like endonuclease
MNLPISLALTVEGAPVPQGSMVATRFGGMRHERASALALWRAQIAQEVRRAAEDQGVLLPIEGPLYLSSDFTLARPKSAPRRRIWPTVKPDLDKLLRALCDGLTQCGAWTDDAQVVRVASAKAYAGGTDAALNVPGVRVVIAQMVAP